MTTPKWKLPKWPSIVAWLVTLGAIITAVTPELTGAPPWVAKALAITAVVIAVLTQSPRKLPPTVAEAHETLDKAGSHRGQS